MKPAHPLHDDIVRLFDEGKVRQSIVRFLNERGYPDANYDWVRSYVWRHGLKRDRSTAQRKTWSDRQRTWSSGRKPRTFDRSVCEACKVSFTPKSNTQRWCEICAPGPSWGGYIKKYGLTKPQYDAMWDKQQGACAICLVPFGSLLPRNVHVDHCHVTGAVRGILCYRCNYRVGVIEQHEWVKAANTYLQPAHHGE